MFKHPILISLLVMGVILCPISLSYGETPVPLTLETVIEKSLANNLELKAAQAKIPVRQAEIRTAGSFSNPFFLSDNGIAERTYRVGLTQVLELGGKRKQRIALAKAQQAVTTAEIETLTLELRARVKRAYTQWFIVQQKQQVYPALLGDMEKTISASQEIEAFQSELILAETQNTYQKTLSEASQAKNTVEALLNEALPSNISLITPHRWGSTPEPLVEGLRQKAFASRPELRENQQELEVVQRQRRISKATRIPDLILSAGPDFVSTVPGQLSVSAFIIATFELPILNRQQGPLAETAAQQFQLEAEQAALRQQIALEVSNAYLHWKNAEAQLKHYEEQLLPKATALSQKAKRQQQAGKWPISLTFRAHQILLNTQLSYLDMLQEAQNAFTDLERAVGEDL